LIHDDAKFREAERVVEHGNVPVLAESPRKGHKREEEAA